MQTEAELQAIVAVVNLLYVSWANVCNGKCSGDRCNHFHQSDKEPILPSDNNRHPSV